ncbi:MAG TPA: lactonase family protein [Bryobacteraceae bacterium]|nr:lactonase family protein [Bryobacteraceae bacterium]
MARPSGAPGAKRRAHIEARKILAVLTPVLLLNFLLLTMPSLPAQNREAPPADYLLYAGGFMRTTGKGIYAFRLHTATGQLSPLGLAAETTNPSFLAVHPNRRFLYAVVNQPEGEVAAFAIDTTTGKLTLLNKVPSRGAGPCFVTLTKTGRTLLLANYGSGSAAAFPVQEDGRLGEATGFAQHSGSSVDPLRQTGPHTHSTNPSPDGRFAIAADLGLDKLFVYRLQNGRLLPNQPPVLNAAPGAGPRHLAFHPSGRYAYVANELNSTVTAFHYDAASGTFREIQTISAIPRDFSGTNYPADLHVHPSGRFLYVSDRGLDAIAAFAIDLAEGTISPIEYTPVGGKTPRNFAIDPAGTLLVAGNEDSDNIVVFRIHAQTGRLTPTGGQASVATPACLQFVPAP